MYHADCLRDIDWTNPTVELETFRLTAAGSTGHGALSLHITTPTLSDVHRVGYLLTLLIAAFPATRHSGLGPGAWGLSQPLGVGAHGRASALLA